MSLKARSLILITPITSWWSEATSDSLLETVSCRLRLHFLEIVMSSIWCLVLPSGDIHVTLWMSLCWNVLPPMTRSLKAQNYVNSSPFSFISPRAWVPMINSLPVLSFPILAFMSPSSSLMSVLGSSSTTVCSAS